MPDILSDPTEGIELKDSLDEESVEDGITLSTCKEDKEELGIDGDPSKECEDNFDILLNHIGFGKWQMLAISINIISEHFFTFFCFFYIF